MRLSNPWLTGIGMVAVGLASVVTSSSVFGQQPNPAADPKARDGMKVVFANDEGSISVGPVRQLTPDELAERERRRVGPAAHAEEMRTLQKRYSNDPTLGSRFSMDDFKVGVEGNVVSVSALAAMYDSLPQSRYRWTLRVHERTRNIVLVNRAYDDQTFTLAAKTLTDPTFKDTVKLGPGDYAMELILHQVPMEFDFATLADNRVDRSHRVLSRLKPVSVGR